MIRPFVVAAFCFFAFWAMVADVWMAAARDDGRYANADPKIRDWIRSLKDKFGVSCCDTADGEEVEGWFFGETGYRIKVKGIWLDVPASALLTVPNLLGYARAWLYYEDGKPKIRCFLPGAGG